ncbi:MAG: glutathione S-transferase family protein [Acetobacteraceae bacterium]|nr:glutathione S-transferase family protein [Acetobacteraceae bacterium]
MKEAAHLAPHSFGQVPTYEEGDLTLFESGAIVLHIAERHAGLLPDDANARGRAIAWMFSAKSRMEPPIVDHGMAMLLERDKTWYEERLPILEDRVRDRLGELSRRLGGCRLARRCIQCRRPADGDGAAQVDRIGLAGGISEPLRLCRPRRSTARLQACFRRSAGGDCERPRRLGGCTPSQQGLGKQRQILCPVR